MFFVDTEKLPFAGYSVVKDHPEGFAPPDPPTRSLARRFDASLRSRGARRFAPALNLTRGSFAPPEPPQLAHPRRASPRRSVREGRSLSLASSGRCSLSLARALDSLGEASLPRLGNEALKSPDPQITKSPNQSGEYRARTGDLLVANQALSQLS